jgi:hypothetical protein
MAAESVAAWREVGFRVVGHLTFIKHYASTERLLRYRHENAYLLAKGNPQKPARPIPAVLEWKYTGISSPSVLFGPAWTLRQNNSSKSP